MARAPSILFVHDNFPAQFGGIGRWLAGAGWDVAFATAARVASSDALGMRILPYAPHRAPSPGIHPYALAAERAALAGQGFARAALAARRGGLRPDVIVAHSGWGSGLYARDVFPEAAFVAYCEWWYNHPGPDVAFLAGLDPRGPRPARQTVGRAAAGAEAAMLERGRNAPIALDIAGAAAALCPTRFQAAQFPQPLRGALTVIHDGIDTRLHAPDPAARTGSLGGIVPEGARLVTYATRGMEPHRGFPQFMAALPAVLAAAPDAVAVIAGENRVAYGGDAERRVDWKARALAEHDLDPARVRFVGKLPRDAYLRLLRRSDAHVYLTVPFVLSWSMLEAMSAGCALVASRTAPVTEFADDGRARLVDMRAPGAIAEAVLETLSDPEAAAARRRRARRFVERHLAAERIHRAKERLLADVA